MKIIGHRGAKGLAPENTLASFKKALEHAVDAIECDVHITKDGEMILHHDSYFLDHNGNKIAILAATLHELHGYKADMTTLGQALEFVNGQVPLLVEIKPGVDVTKICRILEHYQKQGNEVSVLSFDFNLLRTVQRQHPSLQLILNEKWSGVRASFRAYRLDIKRIQMDARWLWLGFIKSMRRRGFIISVYTVNNPEQVKKWQPYLEAVITDRPDLFRNKTK